MKIINLEEQERRTQFALEAAEYFSKNPLKRSYTEGEIEQDCLFALKWGKNDDCVMVFTVADEPEIYEQVIGHVE